MDSLTKGLQSFLVKMGISPDTIDHTTEHYMEHLLHLLEVEDEDAIKHYYGLFGEEQLSLAEIAKACGKSDVDMMERIDKCLRRLAVTPEWESIRHSATL